MTATNVTLTWRPVLKNGLETSTQDIENPGFGIHELQGITTGKLFQSWTNVIVPKLLNEANWRCWRYHLRHMKGNQEERESTADLTTDEKNQIKRILNENNPVFVLHAGQVAKSLGFHMANCRDRVVIDAKFSVKFDELDEDPDDKRAVEILLTGTVFHELSHLMLVKVREEEGSPEGERLTPTDENFRNPFLQPKYESGFRAEYILFDGIPNITPNHLKRLKATSNKFPTWKDFLFYVDLKRCGKKITPHIKPEHFAEILAPETPLVQSAWYIPSSNDRKSLALELTAAYEEEEEDNAGESSATGQSRRSKRRRDREVIPRESLLALWFANYGEQWDPKKTY